MYLCGVVMYCQSMSVEVKLLEMAGISVNNGGGFPASNNSTLTHGISDRRAARVEPAEPAPTEIKKTDLCITCDNDL